MADSILLNDKEAVIKNVERLHDQIMNEQGGRINSMMAPQLVDCDVKERTVTLEFPVMAWELNRKEKLHGGVICTMLDYSAGTTVTGFTGSWGPTVDIDVRFVKFGNPDDIIIGVGKVVSAGRKVFHMESRLYSKATGDLIATSSSTFLNLMNQQSTKSGSDAKPE